MNDVDTFAASTAVAGQQGLNEAQRLALQMAMQEQAKATPYADKVERLLTLLNVHKTMGLQETLDWLTEISDLIDELNENR